jgi:hypothetical protein
MSTISELSPVRFDIEWIIFFYSSKIEKKLSRNVVFIIIIHMIQTPRSKQKVFCFITLTLRKNITVISNCRENKTRSKIV